MQWLAQLPTTRTFFLFPLEVKSLSEVDCNFNFFQVQSISNMLHFLYGFYLIAMNKGQVWKRVWILEVCSYIFWSEI